MATPGTACVEPTTPYPAGWVALAGGARGDRTDPDFFMSAQRTPPATWAPGAVVPGTVYRVIRPLGSGGMGDVYEAEHELLGVRRALKVLSRRLSGRDDLAERLRVEARALASLRHPNIVQVHDLGVSSDGRLFFAMELLAGTTLRDVLSRAGRLDVEQAVRIACALLDALGAAHARGMIHRDVKPENVFLLEDGHLKLLDFGVAKAVHGAQPQHALTAAGMAVGTPRYMAPEQAQGLAVDARADLYSVGVLLWEMLSGRPPFAELDPIAAAVAAATTGIPPLESLGVAAPAPVLEVVRRATSLAREQRYATAAAFAADLRGVRGASVPPPAMPELPTMRFEQSPTAVVPALRPETDDATAIDGIPVSAALAFGAQPTEAVGDATERGMPFVDPRAQPTPTSVALPARVERPAPPKPPEKAPRSAGRWVAIPVALVLVAAGVTWIARPSAAPAIVPAAPPPPEARATVTPPAPEPVSSSPEPPPPAPTASASARRAGDKAAPPPTPPPPKPAGGKALPGSGL